MIEPLVFDVATGSGVDGPGLRTVVFFKGCPLRCAWCHNPEAQRRESETLRDPERCIHCGRCAQGCFSGARRIVGQRFSPRHLGATLAQDKVFFEVSGGGVTFSGGEPLLFIDYLAALASQLAAEGIHVAVETCGIFDLDHYRKVLAQLVDLVLFDIKILDTVEHRRWTGAGNETVQRNLEALAKDGAKLVLRVPLVPGITATETNLRAIARLAARLDIGPVKLLPYNPSGLTKARRLAGRAARKLPPALECPMALEEEARWRRFFKQARSSLGNRAALDDQHACAW